MWEPERPIDPPYKPYELNPEFSVEFDEEDHKDFLTPITINFVGTVNELDGHLEDIDIDNIQGDEPNWSIKKWDDFLRQPKIWEKLENNIYENL